MRRRRVPACRYGAALITFGHPPETAGGRLVESLLRQEREAKAKAA